MNKPSPESDFFDNVWQVVAQIPYGRVTTYGHIAEHLGSRSASRAVGWALNAVGKLNPAPSPMELPCHRVVNRFGGLTGKRHFATPDIMEERLRSEGIAFDDDGCVVLDKHLWIPGENVGE
ncbi:MAG: MGMT family protein [Rubricoccaceae bacterium]|nr:MGMT family protein [Rubricoccaceae bacterium]